MAALEMKGEHPLKHLWCPLLFYDISWFPDGPICCAIFQFASYCLFLCKMSVFV
jgi:hypothetical protein